MIERKIRCDDGSEKTILIPDPHLTKLNDTSVDDTLAVCGVTCVIADIIGCVVGVVVGCVVLWKSLIKPLWSWSIEHVETVIVAIALLVVVGVLWRVAGNIIDERERYHK